MYSSYKEVSEKFGVSVQTVCNWVSRGHLQEGKSFGKVKTCTNESVEALQENADFVSKIKRPGRKNEILQKLGGIEKQLESIESRLANIEKNKTDKKETTGKKKRGRGRPRKEK